MADDNQPRSGEEGGWQAYLESGCVVALHWEGVQKVSQDTESTGGNLVRYYCGEVPEYMGSSDSEGGYKGLECLKNMSSRNGK